MTLSEAVERLIERFILQLYGRKIFDKFSAQTDFTPEQQAIIEAVGEESEAP